MEAVASIELVEETRGNVEAAGGIKLVKAAAAAGSCISITCDDLPL